MGKPLKQSIAEVKKSAAHCRYYAENLAKMMAPQRVKTQSYQTFVNYSPLGKIFLILPFNFPFWLFFKSGIPMLSVGNSVLFRPADNCPLVGKAIEELFKEVEWNNVHAVFNDVKDTEWLIQQCDGVSFTGSSQTGKIIAELSGKHLKKSVMELGGMDPFILMEDGDVKKAVDIAV